MYTHQLFILMAVAMIAPHVSESNAKLQSAIYIALAIVFWWVDLFIWRQKMNNEDQFNQAKLDSYRKFVEREIRFANQHDFLDFCNTHFVYYPPNFGSYIQTLVTTDQEFIEFIQRVSIDDWYDDSGGLMWFVNEGPDNQYVTFNQPAHEDELEDEDGNVYHQPTVLVESYLADYNPYFDLPFSVVKDTPEQQKKVFAPDALIVNPEISAKMPFIARFVSTDTFDRMGSIKGHTLEIISLADVTPGKIMFL